MRARKLVACLVLAAAVLVGRSAHAQRVLECQFVSVDPSSFAYGQWSFAADISGGYLHLLLMRPTDSTPYVIAFDALRSEVSVHKDISNGSAGGPTATFEIATLGSNDLVTIDQWTFGGDDDYDRLILRCPSHS